MAASFVSCTRPKFRPRIADDDWLLGAGQSRPARRCVAPHTRNSDRIPLSSGCVGYHAKEIAVDMDSAEHCRAQAAECRRQLALAQNEAEISILTYLSRSWVMIAGHPCGRATQKRQLYGQPYMRTDPEVTTLIFRIREFNARWRQSTAYTEAQRHFGKNEHDCEPVHICSAWRLLAFYCWGFQGPSNRRRRDTRFRARRRNFFETWFSVPADRRQRRARQRGAAAGPTQPTIRPSFTLSAARAQDRPLSAQCRSAAVACRACASALRRPPP